jgi:putative two-component system response regulator
LHSSSEPRPRVLVVDDDDTLRRSTARIVESFGYEVDTAEDGIEALAKLMLDFDLVLLDGDMPHMDGFEVTERIRASVETEHLPIIMITGLVRPENRRRAIECGVNDFIIKPFASEELQMRSKWLIEMKQSVDKLRTRQSRLEDEVQRRTESLRRTLRDMAEAQRRTMEAHVDTIRRLSMAAEFKDSITASHIERIGLYSERLARALGMSPRDIETIRHAATMHDVGKLGVPEAILMKPGKLSEDEIDVMRAHTTIGAQILSGSDSPLLQMGERIALSHHERWDGKGYPFGLAAEAIPLEGRICAVVDFFDALTMDRPYRNAVPVEEVMDMMRADSGRHFDPEVLEAFFTVIDEILDIRARY